MKKGIVLVAAIWLVNDVAEDLELLAVFVDLFI